MRNRLIYILGGFFIFLTVIISLNMLGDLGNKVKIKQEEEKEQKLIGGEKDEYGCLVAAGYSWCEKKEKCLRLWEEGCDKITTLLASLTP